MIKTSKKRCFRFLKTHLLALSSLFLLSPLKLIPFLHVRTGSSQSQVKLVTRVLPFISNHLPFPFCSPAPRLTPPSAAVWKNKRNCSAAFCTDETLHKTMPPLLSQSLVANNFFFQLIYEFQNELLFITPVPHARAAL